MAEVLEHGFDEPRRRWLSGKRAGERHRPQEPRRALALAAVLALTATASAASIREPDPVGRPALLVTAVDGGQIRLHELPSGRSQTITLPGGYVPSVRDPVAAVGRTVAFLAWTDAAGSRGPPEFAAFAARVGWAEARGLGPTDAVVPEASRGVWLVDYGQPGDWVDGRRHGRLTWYPLGRGPDRPGPRGLPAGWRVAGATSDGLVVTNANGRDTRVWDPGSGEVVRPIQRGGVRDVAGPWALWADWHCPIGDRRACQVNLTHTGDGRTSTVMLPAGHWPTHLWAVSPDGHVATVTHTDDSGADPALIVADGSGQRTVVEGITPGRAGELSWRVDGRMSWTADGRLFVDDGEQIAVVHDGRVRDRFDVPGTLLAASSWVEDRPD